MWPPTKRPPLPRRFRAIFWSLSAAQFVVFAVLFTLGMRTAANYVAFAYACSIVAVVVVRWWTDKDRQSSM
jgi:hypothetical protein